MTVFIMALSLLCHTGKLNKMHHFIVAESGCMNEFFNGMVNLPQIPKNLVQTLA
jgi:hypothetical protein